METEQIERLRHASRKVVRELGLLQLDQSNNSAHTPSHWHTIIEVNKEPGITISKLGHLLLMSTSRISRLVKSLAREGLLELKEGVDKREKYLYLSSDGKEVIHKIDEFSHGKIKGACEFLTTPEMQQIIESFEKYAMALEKNRALKEQVKIVTLSTSRAIRKQIINLINEIRASEFSIYETEDVDVSILKAEQYFYYNKSYNFWYAIDDEGKILGCLGLKKIDISSAEIKRFFVIPSHRGKGVAYKLIQALLKTASKHGFDTLFLGSLEQAQRAHRLYDKLGFKRISRSELPGNFEVCPVDSVFFQGTLSVVNTKMGLYL